MKRFACLVFAAAFSLVASAQEKKEAPAAPEKATLISTYRVFAKPGHEAAFKAAFGAHAKKFHQGDRAWRVYDIISGPDSGGYHIVEGPTTWTAYDDRGDIGPEHTKDYETNIQPHVERQSGDTFATYSKSLSTVGATEFTDKVMVMRYAIKPGMGPTAYDYLKSYKAVWAKRGQNAAVWQASFSGSQTVSVAFRLKNGLKAFDGDLPSTRKVLDELVGPSEYERLQRVAASCFSEITSEIIVLNRDLSSN